MVQGDAAAQVGHEHEGAPQYADQDDLLAGVVSGNLLGDLVHALLQLLLGKQDFLDVFL